MGRCAYTLPLDLPVAMFLISKTTKTSRPGRALTVCKDLVDGVCAPVTVIFARGTSEPGNVGAIVGPPFSAALDQSIGAGNVAFQGVDYPADAPGFLQVGDPEGAATTADLVNQAAANCSDTQIIMSGYRSVNIVTDSRGFG
jgi:Cutinase